MRKRLATACLVLLVSILAGACNLPRPGAAGTNRPLEKNTAAALTVEALGTELAGGTVPAPVSAITTSPQAAPSETPAAPTATASPASPTPAASTPGSTPAPSQTAVPCDQAKFDGETIPDGTVMTPGQSFTKTWTLKNIGSCTWNSSYSIVFISGDALGGPASAPVTTGTVAPGQSVQISLALRAPATEGTFRGNFKLRDPSGAIFGLGPAADQNFWVEIKVTAPATAMIDSYCLADWTSDAGTLPCPGKAGDTAGFILRVDAPKLEDGSIDNEPALWTNPQVGLNGQISGRFPAVVVASGNHFRAVIGCFYGAANCNVKFALKFISDHGSIQTLGEWNEKLDGSMNHLDIDLSSLAGHSVEFILSVTANTASNGQQAFWLHPRIE